MSRAAAPIRILIVEDEPKTAATLRLYFEHGGFEVNVAADGSAGLRLARELRPDLIVLDGMLPEIDGLAVCRALRSESDVPIVLLTARTTEEDKLRGLQLGADDYVTKPFSPREVVARIRAVLRRSRREDADAKGVLRTRHVVVDLDRREASIRGRAVLLPPAEFAILAALARSPGRAFTREELVKRAFGPSYDGLDRTVDAHVMRLRRKIEDPRGEPLLLTVFGIGYKLADEPA
ncbi:MAG: response regulator transcription factor [Acidobacteria bacterium]|nr:response regulator transcription factor [Acidobacteriota bacterium]MCA1611383.1 response regulator transcription factor [Acidobacteriota bacterium]